MRDRVIHSASYLQRRIPWRSLASRESHSQSEPKRGCRVPRLLVCSRPESTRASWPSRTQQTRRRRSFPAGWLGTRSTHPTRRRRPPPSGRSGARGEPRSRRPRRRCRFSTRRATLSASSSSGKTEKPQLGNATRP